MTKTELKNRGGVSEIAKSADGVAGGKRKRAGMLGRSFDVYYRDPERRDRMDFLNAHFVGQGQLAFDVGAHVGDRTASFRRLGARVVALEPQPHVFRALRLIHGRDPLVTLRPEAAGAQHGEITLYVNSDNPTVSTASSDLVLAAPKTPGWTEQVWDNKLTVPLVTLDQLIAAHGVPDFTKIDVEGHEAEALMGLSMALPALSFEVTMIQREVARACIARLSGLGRYEFNFSLGETHCLLYRDWLDAHGIQAALDALPDAANSGDVYARRL